MATITSNRPAVVRGLRGLAQALNLRRRGKGKMLGAELAETVAVAIEHRTVVQQQDPQGRRLAKLTEGYRISKIRGGFPENISVLTGQMMDLTEVIGRDTITANTLVMDYGVDPFAIQKAEWFTEGNEHQRARPFYDVGADGMAAVDGLIEETLNQAVAAAESA